LQRPSEVCRRRATKGSRAARVLLPRDTLDTMPVTQGAQRKLRHKARLEEQRHVPPIIFACLRRDSLRCLPKHRPRSKKRINGDEKELRPWPGGVPHKQNEMIRGTGPYPPVNNNREKTAASAGTIQRFFVSTTGALFPGVLITSSTISQRLTA